MFRLALLIATLTLAAASFQGQWAVFKHQYDKSYNIEEDVHRQALFKAKLNFIEDHNDKYARGEVSYYVGVNQFSDMTRQEVNARMKGLSPIEKPRPQNVQDVDVSDLPDTVDWREKGYVTEVQNQGECGSCWAFSTTGAVEGAHAKAGGKLVKLSEQNLMDCSTKQGNKGCWGGRMDWAFQYIIDNKGIDTEASYPYNPQFTPTNCTFKTADIGATISSFTNVKPGSESDLQKAVANAGPVSVAIYSDSPNFVDYAGGVYDDPDNCMSTNMDHGVLVVGYGTDSDSGKQYWLVKNSWGTSWGIKGYVMMVRNKNNQCGIASAACYPTV